MNGRNVYDFAVRVTVLVFRQRFLRFRRVWSLYTYIENNNVDYGLISGHDAY